jgi:uncharacterized linocin/CFP29 family protein
MNNLHRELAPISDAAWSSIDAEAREAFSSHIAGRRVVDVTGPDGPTLAAVGTGHLRQADATADGVSLAVRIAQPVTELRLPFTVSRSAVDDVERGAKDTDWEPVRQAARVMAGTEDRAVAAGLEPAGITGIVPGSPNRAVPMPSDARQYPAAVSQALETLRLTGVGGPYALLLGAEAYTKLAAASDDGYPVESRLAKLLSGEIIWAPSLDGGLVLSARGGDFELHLGQDLSIGYLSHDAQDIQLYLQESLTFLVHTPEAAVPLTAKP